MIERISRTPEENSLLSGKLEATYVQGRCKGQWDERDKCGERERALLVPGVVSLSPAVRLQRPGPNCHSPNVKSS